MVDIASSSLTRVDTFPVGSSGQKALEINLGGDSARLQDSAGTFLVAWRADCVAGKRGRMRKFLSQSRLERD